MHRTLSCGNPERTSRDIRRVEKGLTLIELLISIAILGLLAVLLISILRPNDDLRCKLEAQRLAAYLSSASNESKMRAGAVRVVFSFDQQGSAKINVAELSVTSTQMVWTEQKRAPHQIASPVHLSEVETHFSGIIKEGSGGFLLFNNGQTPGGVVRLSLKEVTYAVIIPNTSEPPYVERGRGALPALPTASSSRFQMPTAMERNLPGTSGSLPNGQTTSRSSGTSASLSPPALPPRRSPPPARTQPPPLSPPTPPLPDPPPPNDEDDEAICGNGVVDEGEACDDGNDDDQDACLNNCEEASCGDGITRLDLPVESNGEECDDGDDVDGNECTNQCRFAVCGDGILREDLDPRDEGYEMCDDGNLTSGDGCSPTCQSECSIDEDCQSPDEKGPWGACDQDTRTCHVRIPSFRLATISNVAVTDGGIVINPEQPAIAIELQSSLQSWVNAGKLILIVSLGEFGQTYEFAHQAPTAYFFQGEVSGVNQIISRQDLPVYRYEPNYQDCSINGVFDHCYTSGKAIISLYIPLMASESCDYQVLTLNTQLSISAKPGERAQVSLTGYITPKDARFFMLADSLSLADALEGIEPTVDCNGDPKKEAWAITITGEATENDLSAPPIGSPPPGCNPGGAGDDCNPPPTDAEIQGLMDASCVRCHSDDDSQGGLSLEEPFRDKVLRIVSTSDPNTYLVEPRDYEASVLYLQAGEAHAGNRSPLSPASLGRLRDWILGL